MIRNDDVAKRDYEVLYKANSDFINKMLKDIIIEAVEQYKYDYLDELLHLAYCCEEGALEVSRITKEDLEKEGIKVFPYLNRVDFYTAECITGLHYVFYETNYGELLMLKEKRKD